MNKKHISLMLAGAGIVLIFFSFILLCVSADFVGDVKDMLGFDMDISADMVREAARIADELPAGYLAEALDVGGGFSLFALNSRGWFFGFGIISLVAAAVVLAAEEEPGLGGMALALVKAFCAALASGVNTITAGIGAKLPQGIFKPRRVCQSCGARCNSRDSFCSRCGQPLE